MRVPPLLQFPVLHILASENFGGYIRVLFSVEKPAGSRFGLCLVCGRSQLGQFWEQRFGSKLFRVNGLRPKSFL